MKQFLLNLSRFILDNNSKFYQVILERDVLENEINASPRKCQTGVLMFSLMQRFSSDTSDKIGNVEKNDYLERNTTLYLEQDPSIVYRNERNLGMSLYGIINIIGILSLLCPEKYKEQYSPDLKLPNFNSKKLLSYVTELNEKLKNKNFCYCSVNSIVFITPTLKISNDKVENVKKFAKIPVINFKGSFTFEFKKSLKEEFSNRAGTYYSVFLNDKFFDKDLILLNYVTFIGYFKHKFESVGHNKFKTDLGLNDVLFMQNKGRYKYFSDNNINAVEVELYAKKKGYSLIFVQPRGDITVKFICDNTMSILITAIKSFNKNNYSSVNLLIPKFNVRYTTDAADCLYKFKMASLSKNSKKDADVLDMNKVCTLRQHCSINTSEEGINVSDDHFDEKRRNIRNKLYEEIKKSRSNERSRRFLPMSEIYDAKNSITVNFNSPFCAFLVDRDVDENNPDVFMLLVSIKFLGPSW